MRYMAIAILRLVYKRAAGFARPYSAGTMPVSRLLIIDVQSGFINEWTAHVPVRVASLQDSFDQVLVTRLYNPQKSLYRKLIGWNDFSLGSADTQLAFAPRADATIIDKSTYSCVNEGFLSTAFAGTRSRAFTCAASPPRAAC